MYEVHYGASPNVFKVTLMLEELGADYRKIPVALHEGVHFSDEFRRLNPNAKIPVLVDHAPAAGEGPATVFESGAILFYLAEKHGRYLPQGALERAQVMQWVMAGLGPMAGQVHHFVHYSGHRDDYAIARYHHEIQRLYGVLDSVLADRAFIAGAYSIADIAIWPWVYFHSLHATDLADFPNVRRYFDNIGDRPAAIAAMGGLEVRPTPLTDDVRRILFGVLPGDFEPQP